MEVLSLQQAALYTGLSPQTLKIQAERGRLAATKVAGVWVTTIGDVLAYVASRRRNAADVMVICHQCSRTFATPSDAIPTNTAPGYPAVLGCPRCGSPSWGIAAVPEDRSSEYGHRLERALRAAVGAARFTGVGEAQVNDALGAFIRLRVVAGERWQVEFDVDREGAFEPRDASRLVDHVRAVLGEPVRVAEPVAVWRYAVEADRPSES